MFLGRLNLHSVDDEGEEKEDIWNDEGEDCGRGARLSCPREDRDGGKDGGDADECEPGTAAREAASAPGTGDHYEGG